MPLLTNDILLVNNGSTTYDLSTQAMAERLNMTKGNVTSDSTLYRASLPSSVASGSAIAVSYSSLTALKTGRLQLNESATITLDTSYKYLIFVCGSVSSTTNAYGVIWRDSLIYPMDFFATGTTKNIIPYQNFIPSDNRSYTHVLAVSRTSSTAMTIKNVTSTVSGNYTAVSNNSTLDYTIWGMV